MKLKILLFVLTTMIVSITFAQTQQNESQNAPPLVEKRDTVLQPVYIIEKSDTAGITAEYYAPDGNVKWIDGFVVRKGLFSESFEGGWRNFTDLLYDIKWNKLTVKVKELSARVTPEQLKRQKEEEAARLKEQQKNSPPGSK